MIQRNAAETLVRLSDQFKAVAVTGPRQSGKTTLVRAVFTGKPYVNLENPDSRRFAMDDPRGFLSQYPGGAILDEVQRVPELFSYLQQVLDEFDGTGMFILTGSNNFLLQENISQSLAGRVGYLFLLPLSLSELGWNSTSSNELLFRGGYPALYSNSTDSSLFYANYLRTYVERDVRLIKNITDLFAFEKFLRLCAGRTGQLLNMSSIAMESGVDVKTIGSWIGVLETSFIAFRLQPYHKNYNKRIVKMPKLYFYDTGLAVALMGIENTDQLAIHPFRGNLFENLVILELMKRRFNKALQKKLYFWRDNSGHEIDVILERAGAQLPLEIKSGKTVSDDFFKGLDYWRKLTGADQGYLVYDGETAQERSNGISVIPLKNLGSYDL
jgi:uncharacterized protein